MWRRKILGATAVAAGLGVLVSGCETTPAWMHSSKVAAPSPCADFSFPVYFKEWSAGLTDAALQVISDSAARSKACRVGAVTVVGLSGAKGSAEQNLELSKRRAEAVAKALTDKGFPAPAVDVDAVGEQGAVTKRGTERPLRRRAEVQVHFAS